jgi:hypothetical protein
MIYKINMLNLYLGSQDYDNLVKNKKKIIIFNSQSIKY